jgi:predicted transcriptional regulator
MKTTIDYLNAIKAKTGAVSDYALAKEMGITRAAVSIYMAKKRTFSDETALKVARILDIDASEVLLAAHIERSQSETVKTAYKSIFERLGGVAASVLVATTLFSNPAPVKAATGNDFVNDVYYVK